MKEPAPCKRAIIFTLCTVLLSLFAVDYGAHNELLLLCTFGFFTFLTSIVAAISCSRPYRHMTK